MNLCWNHPRQVITHVGLAQLLQDAYEARRQRGAGVLLIYANLYISEAEKSKMDGKGRELEDGVHPLRPPPRVILHKHFQLCRSHTSCKEKKSTIPDYFKQCEKD